jgi:peroxiredoxin
MNDAKSELASIRETLGETGEVVLKLSTDSEWRHEIKAQSDGLTFKGLLASTNCIERFEELKELQASKNKTIEGVRVILKGNDGVVESFDSLTAALETPSRAGDEWTITYKIGNNS